jgi:hypothetical protein
MSVMRCSLNRDRRLRRGSCKTPRARSTTGWKLMAAGTGRTGSRAKAAQPHAMRSWNWMARAVTSAASSRSRPGRSLSRAAAMNRSARSRHCPRGRGEPLQQYQQRQRHRVALCRRVHRAQRAVQGQRPRGSPPQWSLPLFITSPLVRAERPPGRSRSASNRQDLWIKIFRASSS